MSAPLRTLLARVIDYAGLYPPARLPLVAAAAEFATLRGDTAGWMLARFVCPAARVAELAALWGAGDGVPLVVAAIGGGGGDDEASALMATREDVRAIAAATGPARGLVVVDQLELRLPAGVVAAAAPDAVSSFLARLCEVAAPLARPALLIAVEAPVAGASPATVTAAIDGIARHNRAAAAHDRLPVAFKMRCGGLEAAAVPGTAEVAAALAVACHHGVAIKATQGLHHPVRRHDEALGVATHGFVNLLAAAALARACRLEPSVIAEILADERPDHFEVTGDALRWNGLNASVADLAACRRHALMSFGSCSFAEPRDDLAALGWLEV